MNVTGKGKKMGERYNPQQIESKWQARWEADGLYRSVVDPARPKHYALTMLPYPSGDLHIGHWYAMAPSDARARWMRMRGYNVLFPMGFDAFGLPAENAAIQHKTHPKTWTYANIARMRKQLHSMGAIFDWEREAVSCDPEYYRWTEWFFLQFFKHGLAYRELATVDFCPHCNTTLAREQVWGEDRHCERCGTPVIKKDLEQWFFRITKYADELLNHDKINWPERVKVMQRNWIGKSEGAHVTFKTEIERTDTSKEKTGVFTGGYAINPVNGERIPVWVADYVLMSYGMGAIMAVPAHDQRDFEFARKFDLPIRVVIQSDDQVLDSDTMTEAYPHDGKMINSGTFDGTPADV